MREGFSAVGGGLEDGDMFITTDETLERTELKERVVA